VSGRGISPETMPDYNSKAVKNLPTILSVSVKSFVCHNYIKGGLTFGGLGPVQDLPFRD
jgi:hypothetical protein